MSNGQFQYTILDERDRFAYYLRTSRINDQSIPDPQNAILKTADRIFVVDSMEDLTTIATKFSKELTEGDLAVYINPEDTSRQIYTWCVTEQVSHWGMISGGGGGSEAGTLASEVLDGLMSSADFVKLKNIAPNANNYVHPSKHTPADIACDIEHRFVKDTDITAWNDLISKVHLHSNMSVINNITANDILNWNSKQNKFSYTPEDIKNKGIANGYASLDASGLVPVSQLPSSVKEIKVVNTIADRNAITDKFQGLRVHVVDATGDTTVSSGWAEYLCDGTLNWVKTGEKESIDIVLKWANLIDRPTSVVSSIDDAVVKKHVHSNQLVLDGTQESFTTALKASIHNPSVVGTKYIDEAAIADKKFIGYNSVTGKIEYKTVIDDSSTSTDTTWSSDKESKELALKANNNAVVHSIGDEAIKGLKTFTMINVGGVSIGNGLVDGKDISNLTKADIANFDAEVINIIKTNWEASVTWGEITGKPLSAIADIDDAVIKKHDHANKATLDTITQATIDKINSMTSSTKTEASTTNGNILINGAEVIVYTHPEAHAATMITEDATHRFVTDTDKSNWDSKVTTADLTTLLSNKVDKVSGKVLSANDYTTIEKTKLAGIADGAQVNQNAFSRVSVSGQSNVDADSTTDTLTLIAGSNISILTDSTNDAITISNTYLYIHPDTHAATMITEDINHKFVTDAEKTAWNSKQSALGFIPEDVENKGVANGYASLDTNGLVPVSQIPVNDIPSNWNTILNRPASTTANIDDAVAKRHAHTNMTLLSNISEVDGQLAYKGTSVVSAAATDIINDTAISTTAVYSSSKVESLFSKINLSNETVRQAVLAAQVGIDGNTSYLYSSANSLVVGIIAAADNPLILSIANGFNESGAIDYIVAIKSFVASAWTIPSNVTAYLYIDRNPTTGAITYGYSTLKPDYSNVYPSSPASGQNFFHINGMKMYEYNGTSWVAKQRIFVGSCFSSTGYFNWVKSIALRGRFEGEWFGVASNNTYAKDHNIGMNPKNITILAANASNLNNYRVLTTDLARNCDKGFDIRCVNDKNVVLRTFNIADTAEDECFAFDSAGNIIGFIDRLKIIVERGW
jgi:hypothetical protein